MRLYSIVIKDIFRRRTKLMVGVLGVVIAASAIVAVITTFTAATDSLKRHTGYMCGLSKREYLLH
ncbi:MAG TPA: hypothetical protein C5S51_00865 [Methanosarcinaceae archaeon]|nr:hypothetical protein [Methanosarcinaceae archaeon]